MPFTPAHPAIILPLLKMDGRYVSATGLVVGSIVPDFEYFMNMSVQGQHSHTVGGLFYFDIPLGILIAILFHVVVKRNFIDNMPASFQRRLRPLRDLEFIQYVKQYPWGLVSGILIGAASHLLWDSFTHADGYFVKHLSFYDSVFLFDGVRYPIYYALQHISSLVGCAAIGVYIIFMKQNAALATSRPSLIYWMAIVLIASLVLFVRFTLDRVSLDFGNFVVSTITAICISLVITGLIRFNQATR
jgi:Domain of unknown function (DUF4184)